MPNGIPSTTPHNLAASPLEPLPISDSHSTGTSNSQTLSPSSFLATASSITHTIATAAEGRRDHLKSYVEGVKTKNAVDHVVGHITGKKHGPGEGFGGKEKEGEDYEVAAEGGGDHLLPKVKEGEGKAPDVVYGEGESITFILVAVNFADFLFCSQTSCSTWRATSNNRRRLPRLEPLRQLVGVRHLRRKLIDGIRLLEGRGRLASMWFEMDRFG